MKPSVIFLFAASAIMAIDTSTIGQKAKGLWSAENGKKQGEKIAALFKPGQTIVIDEKCPMVFYQAPREGMYSQPVKGFQLTCLEPGEQSAIKLLFNLELADGFLQMKGIDEGPVEKNRIRTIEAGFSKVLTNKKAEEEFDKIAEAAGAGATFTGELQAVQLLIEPDAGKDMTVASKWKLGKPAIFIRSTEGSGKGGDVNNWVNIFITVKKLTPVPKK